MKKPLVLLVVTVLVALLYQLLVRGAIHPLSWGDSQPVKGQHDAHATGEVRERGIPNEEAGADAGNSPTTSQGAPGSGAAKGDEQTATLVISTRAAGSHAPLAHVRVFPRQMDPQTARMWGGSLVESSVAGLGQCPISDERGIVKVDVLSGVETALTAQAEGDSFAHAHGAVGRLQAGEHKDVALDLSSDGDVRFYGRVVLSEGNRPIVGAFAEVVQADCTGSANEAGEFGNDCTITVMETIQISHTGIFKVQLASWKPLDLRVKGPGVGMAIIHVTEGHETEKTAMEIVLQRAASLQVRVVDAQEVPVSGSKVRLWTEAFRLYIRDHGEPSVPLEPEVEWLGRTNQRGECTLANLPSDVALHAECTSPADGVSHLRPEVTLGEGEGRRVEWRIGAGCRIDGTLIDQAGETISGRIIWIERASRRGRRVFQIAHSGRPVLSAMTDQAGRFMFADIDSGAWWIGPGALVTEMNMGYSRAIAPIAETFQIPVGSVRYECTIRAQRGLYVSGRAIRPDGSPAELVSVEGHYEDAIGHVVTQTDENGEFVLGPLVQGECVLVAHGRQDADSDETVATVGTRNVNLQLKSGYTIAGVVINPETGLGCNAEVAYTDRREQDGEYNAVFADSTGKFVINGVRPGIYDLSARTARLAAIARGVRPASAGSSGSVVLALRPGAQLRVRYSGGNGYLNYTVLCDQIAVASDSLEPNRYADITVPQGHITVVADWGSGATETQELDCAVGNEKTMTFTSK